MSYHPISFFVGDLRFSADAIVSEDDGDLILEKLSIQEPGVGMLRWLDEDDYAESELAAALNMPDWETIVESAHTEITRGDDGVES